MILEDIAGTIQKLAITHIDLTPSLARLLHPDEVPSLCRGVFITGGEQLKQEILNVWGPKGVIYNGYGPTEATIGCTMYPRVPASGKPSNIGSQFDNVGSYVFIPGSTAAVIRGGVGELCVSGKLVGRGYLNRPGLTREKFQYIPEYQERVYRTGDLVRLLHDGTFEFLGRVDDQVKLRGQRLEIGEINETIKNGVDGVQEITTLLLQHPKQQNEQLVSFVVLKSLSSRQRVSEIRLEPIDSKVATKMRDVCGAKLPSYMIPAHFVALNSFPLSANNKADAKQLKQIYSDLSSNELQRLSSDSRLGRPSTGREAEFLKVLSEVVGVSHKDIDATSNIFELGVDSISVIRLARLLKKTGFRNAQVSVVMKSKS
ncbi:non-ribosomal peptide synthetase nps2 [Trichoglossum hirsutum]|uniref:Non-ribosomal peptide synthetase nps2 n=1 Tax=Trichoglossum hirsutum TaxID=265104 RepID=A0A9P8RSE1_9PEZI|nr:non-ribosomal peptide synthetase nps2 [Trichoglossum hirsutum]